MQISFDALPPLPKLFLDYIRDHGEASRFYPHSPTIEAVVRFAHDAARYPAVSPVRVASALGAQQARWGADDTGARKLADGAVAVVTGQQAGLLTGPLLSVLKALSAVKMARVLEESGIPAVPVFWVAADDHDHEEIEWTGILNRDLEFQRLRAGLENEHRSPVSWIRYSDQIRVMVGECFRSLPESDYLEPVRQLVERSYRPQRSPVDAFAEMMLALFPDSGLIVADPMERSLRELVAGELERVRVRETELRAAVLERTAAITEAGYDPQVRVDETFTGLFMFDGDSRRPVDPNFSGLLPGSVLSPNVLLRPFIQDSLFPTAAYIGGPAEISYFAQASAAYEVLGRPMPPVYPRITATLVEPAAARVLRKYDIRFEDVLAGPALLRDRAVGSTGDAGLFGEVEESIRAEAERLRPLLERTDKTLGGALDNSIRKLSSQVESIRARFVAAETRQNEVMDRQLTSLTGRLFPDKMLQERAVNIVSFLVRYGLHLIPLMDQRLELDGSSHQLMEI